MTRPVDVVAPPTRLRHAAGRALRFVRSVPERLLHGRRHRAQLTRLVLGARPARILVVCYGNVCRSPYLEAVLRRALPDVTIDSAGFVGPDRGPPELGATVARARGIDLSTHRSKVVTPTLAQEADLVIVMDAAQRDELVLRYRAGAAHVIVAGDLDPAPFSVRRVVDPWGKPRPVFEDSYARLDRCAATLVRHLPPASDRPTL